MTHLRSVLLPEVVKNMAGKDYIQALKDFDRHYMPDSRPDVDDSARGDDSEHRSALKQNEKGVSKVHCYYSHYTYYCAYIYNCYYCYYIHDF